MAEEKKLNVHEIDEDDEEESEVEQNWDDWNADDGEDSDSDVLLCLFCDSKFNSAESLFQHCCSTHSFDFHKFRRAFGLDFYDSFKLINYIRSQVAVNKCWSCGLVCRSNRELQDHLHDQVELVSLMQEDGRLLWQDDKYLKPFLQDDSLLYNFEEDEDVVEDTTASFDKEELMRELQISEDLESINLDDDGLVEKVESVSGVFNEPEEAKVASYRLSNLLMSVDNVRVKGTTDGLENESLHPEREDKHLKIAFAKASAREKKNVNDGYFGAYSSFGIHREMISDKVRMDAYRGAILNNPSLMSSATVMDVGCGTGILSLFAAQAGASKVIAVEASEKMASVAAQIAKENGWLWGSSSAGNGEDTGIIRVVRGMVEELDKSINIPSHSIDVLLSEWMGYCLLYETMLDSVLYARDKWLKPGGAMLPDTATIYVAGFGKGGTSIPFWEDVYGFNMSCIGKEVVEDSAKLPIVDVVDNRDIMTNAVVIQNFDLMTVKPDELDFTTSFELELKPEHATETQSTPWCYGVVLWFETGFTSRFCKELPTVLSTSPYTPKTHWSQTILTFCEPIAMGSEKPNSDVKAVIGSYSSPVTRIQSRISIVRAAQHRSIDISLETSAVALDGRKHSWPVQIFNL